MKTTIKAISVLFIGLFIFSSCGKYEDGPAFSLLSKKARLTGEWVIDEVTVNDADQTAAFKAVLGDNFVLEIEKDGVYRTEGSNPDKGKWELGEDKDDVYMLSDAQGASEMAFRILRLKNKELWLRQTDSNGDVTEYHYDAK